MLSKMLELIVDRPVIPVVEIECKKHGPPLAEALLAGGIDIVEITLRTEAALDAAESMIAESAIVVGLGTVLEADQLRFAVQIGAQFCASPGINLDLFTTAEEEKIPYLPGVCTPSEVMLARDLECALVKFFPAIPGTANSAFPYIARAFPQLKFCLTGGVNAANLAIAFKRSCVVAVGGSWIAPREAICNGDWRGISDRAAAALCAARRISEERGKDRHLRSGPDAGKD